MSMTLQETFDRFLLDLQNQDHAEPEAIHKTEQTFHLFSEYLIYYSDLFQPEDMEEEISAQAWEESLDSFISKLMQGEHQEDASISLDELPLERITGEYLRDFIGWHLLREPSTNSLMIQECTETLLSWLQFTHQHHWMDSETFESCNIILQDTLPDAKRAAIAAHLLLYHIRLGGGVSPRLRGTRFSSFKEGHARIAQIKGNELWLSFDSEPDKLIGPIALPEAILQQLREGDVIDIEVGLRNGVWNIVDVGPLYPAVVYVAAEEMTLPDKLT
ncbi:MAG: hypothetical protein Q9N02_05865 [Ghiorsea sp.]|nr:hypothetical protein [Ghiorsea sp.]